MALIPLYVLGSTAVFSIGYALDSNNQSSTQQLLAVFRTQG